LAEFILGNPLRKIARKHRLLQHLLWRLDYGLVWTVVKLARLLPVDTASRFGERVGAWIGPKLRKKTAIFKENLRQAFPEAGEDELDTLVRRSWGRAGRVLAEYPHLDRILSDPGRLEIEIREPVVTYDNPSHPSVMVSAHLSNWEINCSAMAKMGIPNASLYSPPTNPLLDSLLQKHREALNCELIPRDNSTRLLMRALKQGRTAGIVMDRRVDDGVPVEFFGRDKPSTLIPARLALKFHCALVPAQVVRLRDARYRVIFHPPIRPADHCVDEDERALDMTRQLHRLFEDWIRERPEDWFCSKRLWPKVNIVTTEETGSEADIDSYAA
jgi:KDO2-lipid IV(A) lauroyltransferase